MPLSFNLLEEYLTLLYQLLLFFIINIFYFYLWNIIYGYRAYLRSMKFSCSYIKRVTKMNRKELYEYMNRDIYFLFFLSFHISFSCLLSYDLLEEYLVLLYQLLLFFIINIFYFLLISEILRMDLGSMRLSSSYIKQVIKMNKKELFEYMPQDL